MNQEKLNNELKEATRSINEMAEKQGFGDSFTYYTLDNETDNRYPHVHVCAPNHDKFWEGQPLKTGNPFKTIASVKLNKINGYSPENLEFEEIKDEKINSNKYKEEICDWLNSKFNGRRINKETNAAHCINSYLMNNEKGVFNNEVEKLLNETEELGSWTKEMLKPENLIGPFDTVEALMKSLWDED